MEIIEINYFAIFVAALVSMTIGSIWYGPLFGKIWMSQTKILEKDIEKTSKLSTYKMYLGGLVVEMALAYALFMMGSMLGLETIVEWAKAGFLVGFFFIGISALTGILWEKKPIKLWAVNTFASAITLAAMGIVLALL